MKVSWSWPLNMVISDDYHWLNGHEHGQTPGDSEGQRSLTTVHGVAKNQTWLSDWITEFFAVGSSPGHCGIFKSILGIYTPVTSPSQAVTATTNIFRYHQTLPGGQKSLHYVPDKVCSRRWHFERPAERDGNLPWTFIGRTGTEAEAPIVWSPDEKSWLIGKEPSAGKDWRQEEKGEAEEEMVR